jgi:tetratricopeptide (TPR) repeat protein
MRRTVISILSVVLALSAIPAFAQTKVDALELYRDGKYPEAIDACIAEIQVQPNNIESHVVLCWSLVAAKRYEEADSWADKGRALSKYDPRLIEIQAEAKYWRGQNEQALKLFQDYISYAPNGSRISGTYYLMGEIYLRLAKFRHADMAFSAAIQLEGLHPAWWVRLGYAREMAKDYRHALEAYNKALELDPNVQDAARGKDRVTQQL